MTAPEPWGLSGGPGWTLRRDSDDYVLAGIGTAFLANNSVDLHFEDEPTSTNRWAGDLPSSPCGLRRG